MKVSSSGIVDNGSSILLMLEPSEELISAQEWAVSMLPGQVPVKELHVTLMRSAGLDSAFPPPPPIVEFSADAYLVSDGAKTSVFLRATESSQLELTSYVMKLEESMNASGLRNGKRVFHVSLSNLVGEPRQSVANVWEYSITPLRGSAGKART